MTVGLPEPAGTGILTGNLTSKVPEVHDGVLSSATGCHLLRRHGGGPPVPRAGNDVTAHTARFGSLPGGGRAVAGGTVWAVGLSLRTIGNLERERTRWPYRDTLRRLADGLGLDGQDGPRS